VYLGVADQSRVRLGLELRSDDSHPLSCENSIMPNINHINTVRRYFKAIEDCTFADIADRSLLMR
jgi:hypothetical protein